MVKVKIGNFELGLRFNYQFKFSKRLSIEKTIDDVIVQHQPYVIRDTQIEWEYPFAEESERNLFLNLYKNGEVFLFTDYSSKRYNCILVEFEEQKRAGKYFLKGTFLILEEL